MNKLYRHITPSFIVLMTIIPMVLAWGYLCFSENGIISHSSSVYLLNSLTRSLFYSLIGILICLCITFIIFYNIRDMQGKFLSIIILFFVLQLQIGVIPKLYGFLGAYSSSGIWGLMSNLESPFAYSSLGVILSLVYVYSPFFFIPLIASLKNNDSLIKSTQILGANKKHILLLQCKVYKSAIIYSAVLFLALSLMDYTCSDIIGGGKYDTYGKALYRTAITFRESFTAITLGLSVLLVILALMTLSRRYE